MACTPSSLIYFIGIRKTHQYFLASYHDKSFSFLRIANATALSILYVQYQNIHNSHQLNVKAILKKNKDLNLS